MRNAKRGRGSHRGVYLCAAAALGIALSGCGGGGRSSSAAATGTDSPPAAQSTPSQSTTVNQDSPSTQDGSGGSGSSTGSTGSGSGGSAPPTASADAVTLNWIPPTENVDGTPLTNLAGYDIHYGTASGKYTQTVAVSNPGIATYVVANLAPGKYYFSVGAVNSDGAESPLSAEVSATVN